jgi:hypothetical protein
MSTSLGPLSIDTLTLPPISTGQFSTLHSIQPVDTIQGRMVSVQIVVNHDEKEMLGTSAAGFQEMMKRRLCEALLQEMVKSKTIEFTSQMDPVELVTTYRARIYVTPDTQVRLLRKNQSL